MARYKFYIVLYCIVRFDGLASRPSCYDFSYIMKHFTPLHPTVTADAITGLHSRPYTAVSGLITLAGR